MVCFPLWSHRFDPPHPSDTGGDMCRSVSHCFIMENMVPSLFPHYITQTLVRDRLHQHTHTIVKGNIWYEFTQKSCIFSYCYKIYMVLPVCLKSVTISNPTEARKDQCQARKGRRAGGHIAGHSVTSPCRGSMSVLTPFPCSFRTSTADSRKKMYLMGL